MDMILTIIESSTSNKKMDLQLESNNYIPIYTANKTKSLNIDQLYSDLFNIHKSFTVSGFMSSITKQFLDCLKKTRSKTFKISLQENENYLIFNFCSNIESSKTCKLENILLSSSSTDIKEYLLYLMTKYFHKELMKSGNEVFIVVNSYTAELRSCLNYSTGNFDLQLVINR